MQATEQENTATLSTGKVGRFALQQMAEERKPTRILELLHDHGQRGFIRDGVAYGICDVSGKAERLESFRAARIWLGY